MMVASDWQQREAPPERQREALPCPKAAQSAAENLMSYSKVDILYLGAAGTASDAKIPRAIS